MPKPERPKRKYSPPSVPFACSHRGEEIGKVDCGCSGNRIIYSCPIQGRCIVAPLRESTYQGATCSDCQQRRHPAEDAAIITPHFNPSGFAALRSTYQQWVATMPARVLTIEATPQAELAGSHWIPTDDRHRLWQKERLINNALALLDSSICYVAWIDHDLIFTRSDWLAAGVEAIYSGLDCVQLFDRVTYLDRNGDATSHQPGAVAEIQAGRGPSGAPGGAWMASRKWLESIGGLYDRNICGGGDATFLQAVTGAATSFVERQAPRLRDDCLRYVARVGGAKFAHIPGEVRHLWHGDRADRQYISRDAILCEHDFDPQAMIEVDRGAWRWSDAAPARLREDVAKYFADRREDG